MKIQLLKRLDIEQHEREHLASYAVWSLASKGRVFPSEEHEYRTAFQRDRDRIIHSAAFRRLEYKTQVFIPHEQDHFRTRLTHTIEVAQISRTIARILCLNEDLAEAIALVHDLGHTPFGHAGEDILDELLADFGGFNHNRQSLRIVDYLEMRYEQHPGLNLTYEVREGIAKHETKVKINLDEFKDGELPALEAMIVDIADEIAYNSHDIDDGLSSGLVTMDVLDKDGVLTELLKHDISELKIKQLGRYELVRNLINVLSLDVIAETSRRLKQNNIISVDDVRNSKNKICDYSVSIDELVSRLKIILFENLYQHEKLTIMTDWGKEIIATLFSWFMLDPARLPQRYQNMLSKDKKEIVIADYIAGMTDRYATKIYNEIK